MFKILLVIIIIIIIDNNFSHVSPGFLTFSLISVYTLNVRYVCHDIADKWILVSNHLDLLWSRRFYSLRQGSKLHQFDIFTISAIYTMNLVELMVLNASKDHPTRGTMLIRR